MSDMRPEWNDALKVICPTTEEKEARMKGLGLTVDGTNHADYSLLEGEDDEQHRVSNVGVKIKGKNGDIVIFMMDGMMCAAKANLLPSSTNFAGYMGDVIDWCEVKNASIVDWDPDTETWK
jgi:hypothetical protein